MYGVHPVIRRSINLELNCTQAFDERRQRTHDRFKRQPLQPCSGILCPTCGRSCASDFGLRSHQTKPQAAQHHIVFKFCRRESRHRAWWTSRKNKRNFSQIFADRPVESLRWLNRSTLLAGVDLTRCESTEGEPPAHNICLPIINSFSRTQNVTSWPFPKYFCFSLWSLARPLPAPCQFVWMQY